jgi:hypothetical protein
VLTGDSIAITFDKQKQSNPDMVVYVASPLGSKETYQDVKSGMNVVKHSSRGSLGLLTFDINMQVIPFTTHDFSLRQIQKERLGLKHDANSIEEFYKT